MIMAGNPIVGFRSVPEPDYAREELDISGLNSGVRFASVATLLNGTTDAVHSPGSTDVSSGRQPAELEEISLAVHKLRTNGMHYRVVKRLLDILVVCALTPCLLPL